MNGVYSVGQISAQIDGRVQLLRRLLRNQCGDSIGKLAVVFWMTDEIRKIWEPSRGFMWRYPLITAESG